MNFIGNMRNTHNWEGPAIYVGIPIHLLSITYHQNLPINSSPRILPLDTTTDYLSNCSVAMILYVLAYSTARTSHHISSRFPACFPSPSLPYLFSHSSDNHCQLSFLFVCLPHFLLSQHRTILPNVPYSSPSLWVASLTIANIAFLHFMQ